MHFLRQLLSRSRAMLVTWFTNLPPIAPEPSLLSPREFSLPRSLSWVFIIFSVSTIYYLIYFTPVHLHDISHFATAGVSLVRDHRDLIYPYNGPTYDSFQTHTAVFDTRTNYPSKLYSALYGLIYLARGQMRLEYTQWLSFGALLLVNALLYLIGRRFFSGLRLASFLVAVSLLPVMRFTMNPGIDIFGYLGLLLLLWLSLTCRIHPILFGLYAGLLAHFRAQMLAIPFVFPFLIAAFSRRRFFSQTVIPVFLGFGLGYAALALAFLLWLHSSQTANPVGFYTSYFGRSMLGAGDRLTIVTKFGQSISALIGSSQLFFLAPVALACALYRKFWPARNLALGAIVYVLVPVIIYSFDRYSLPAARYYIFAVPVIVLALFLALQELQNRWPRMVLGWLFPAVALVSALTWYNFYGIPWANLRTTSFVSRAQYLDFPGAEHALAQAFGRDDIVIVNHALPTGLSRLHNILYVPTLKNFQEGDNHQIKGLAFVYSTYAPNDFFTPKDWLIEGTLPPAITDHHGLVFRQAFSTASKLLNPDGSLQSEAHLVIYLKSDS